MKPLRCVVEDLRGVWGEQESALIESFGSIEVAFGIENSAHEISARKSRGFAVRTVVRFRSAEVKSSC